MNDGGRIRYRMDTATEAVGIATFFLSLVLVAPGAVATFAAAHAFDVALDVGQRWTFAVAVSVAVIIAGCLASAWQGLVRYLVLSLALSFALFVLRFGVRAEWAVAFFEYFRPS